MTLAVEREVKQQINPNQYLVIAAWTITWKWIFSGNRTNPPSTFDSVEDYNQFSALLKHHCSLLYQFHLTAAVLASRVPGVKSERISLAL